MWGHLAICQCPLCHCLPRIFALIRLGRAHPGFGHWVCERLRLLEAECRDELQRRGPPPLPAQDQPEAPPEAGGGEEKGAATPFPPKGGAEEKRENLELFPKGKPPVPPTELATPKEEKEASKTEEPLPRPPEITKEREENPGGACGSWQKRG